MKKFIAYMLALVLLAGLVPCAGSAEAGTVNVVTTIFPIYDWVRQIAGESGRVAPVMLLDSGVDLHSFQPSAKDILTVSSADLFVYVGGESDAWVENVLAAAVNPSLVSLSLTKAMGEDLKEEEIVEGMEHDHDHGHEEDEDHDHEDEDHDHEEEHEHDEDHDHDHEEEEEYDEHVWLSLRNAVKLVNAIAGVLAAADPDGADAYLANAAAYTAKLQALDAAYAETVNAAAHKTLLFGDRFPFRYMTDDYGLSYYAAFTGCSAESEASFETVAFLARKTDELGLPAVMTIEGPNHRIAETVVATASDPARKILTLNSMQSVTAEDVKQGADYLSMMEENLKVLKEALN